MLNFLLLQVTFFFLKKDNLSTHVYRLIIGWTIGLWGAYNILLDGEYLLKREDNWFKDNL